jgi:malate dehydrogenase
MAGPFKVCVTGAAGQIGYSILPLIASGQLLGPDTKVVLSLLDIAPAEDALRGVVMELHDCAFPLVTDIQYGSDPHAAFSGADYIIFLGGFPRKAGMERKELLQRNMNIFKAQGTVLNEVGKSTVKCLVVANPANTNCLILSHFAPNINKRNFTAMTRLDQNRSVAQISQRIGVAVPDVKNIIIWGNHSSTQYPDVNHATVGGRPVRELVADDQWLNTDFITTVQKRGAAIIEARKLSSAMSAAYAAVNHVRDWARGTPEGEWVSFGLISDGSYGIDEGLVYSFPVTISGGEYRIVEGLQIDEFSREKMEITKAELLEEKAEALESAS